jgi:uncharacterized protein YggU (UPF0235/DUF167 family)
VRLAVRVRPGARQTAVGGSHDGALVVRVRERAVDGHATAAVRAALAAALGVRRSQITLVSGATSRTKVYDVPDGVAAMIAGLRDGAAPCDEMQP